MLNESQITQIQFRCQAKRNDLGLGPGAPLGSKVFSLLDGLKIVTFRFPVQDLEFAALIGRLDEHTFCFINSALPRAKQHFAAAHELGHYWYDTGLLDQGIVCDITDDDSSNQYEAVANRFAADFLVPESGLRGYLSQLPEQCDWLDRALLASHYFEVPLKTLVRRLIEERLVSRKEENYLLQTSAQALGERTALLGLNSTLEEPTEERSVSPQFVTLIRENRAHRRITQGKMDELLNLIHGIWSGDSCQGGNLSE